LTAVKIDVDATRSRDGFLFEQFLKFAPDAIVGVDLDGRITLANAQAATLFGYTHDELVGERVEMLVPEPFRGKHERHRKSYFGDPRTRSMGAGLDLLGRRKDGGTFPAEISLSSIDTGDGVIATAAIRDVSDRVRAQRRFMQFLEFAPDAIVGVTPAGRIELVNAQTEAMFGYEREELVGELVEILVPERFRAKHSSHRGMYFGDPRTRPMGEGLDLFGRRKDGAEFPAEISLSSIDSDEGTLAIAAIRDVTDRVEAERERKMLEVQLERSRREQALRERGALEEQLNQMRRLDSVGQLAGGIAHDFNNILGVILNSAAFVAEDLDEDSPLLEDVEEIRRSAQRAAALTRQLLIFSRRDVVHPQSLDLNEVVSDLERLLRRVLGEHVLLETRFASHLWRVMADPGQVEQVLVNLVVNARDAMAGGGRLIIETSNVDLDDEYAALHPPAAPGPHVRLAVSDTGSGMDREAAARAFEPFFTTKPKGEGTGLGLATVYGIVTDGGGNVQIYSEAQLGTTIKVQLPATSVGPGTKVEHRHPVLPSRGETVLVVEDEDSVRRVTHRILLKAGYEVLTAVSGREALDVCADPENTVDLLLTDVIMPGMLGPGLAERVAVLRPGTPVLFMSGYSDQLVAHTTDTGEEIPLVEKPFTAESLLQGVGSVLRRADP
jgi:PAS domain S-box-containing protein